MWKTLVVTVGIATCVRRAEAQDGPGWDIRLSVPGEPGKDYPTLGSIPRTSFTCGGKEAGYYADVETGCQAFRVCTTGATYGYQSFLCPNGTIFNQEVFVCDWWMNVNCQGSEQHFQMNNKFEQLRVGPQMMNDVEKMIMYPMRNPYQNQNNLPNKKVVMQVYNPPSGQLSPNPGSQLLDDNRNPRARFSQNSKAQSNNKPAVLRNQYIKPNNYQAYRSPQLRLNGNTQSTPSPRYSNPQTHGAQFNLLPTSTSQPDLEVTYRKQQYTYPSQADKQYTYKIPSSQMSNLNQHAGLTLQNAETQKNYADAQQNLVSDNSYLKNNDNSFIQIPIWKKYNGGTAQLDLKSESVSPRIAMSQVPTDSWIMTEAPVVSTTIDHSDPVYERNTRKYLTPNTEPHSSRLTASQPTVDRERNKYNSTFTISSQFRFKSNDKSLSFADILTKQKLDLTVNNIVKETKDILDNTPPGKASKLRADILNNSTPRSLYLPPATIATTDVETISPNTQASPFILAPKFIKSSRLISSPLTSLEPPKELSVDSYRLTSKLYSLPSFKQKIKGEVPEINYVSPSSNENTESFKLSIPAKTASVVLYACNCSNYNKLEILNVGNNNYLILTNKNMLNRKHNFIPISKLVIHKKNNVLNPQAYVQDFFNNAVEQAQTYQNSVNQNFQNFISSGVAQNTNTANLQPSQNLEQLAKPQVVNLQLANEYITTAKEANEQSLTSTQQRDTQQTGTLKTKLQNTAPQFLNNANTQTTNDQQLTNSLNNNLRQNSIDSSGAFYSGYFNQGQNVHESGNFIAQKEQNAQSFKNQHEQANYELNQFNANTQIDGQQIDTTSNYQTGSNLNSNLNVNYNVQNNGVQAEQLVQLNGNNVTQQLNNQYVTATQENLPSIRDENGNFYSSQFFNGGQQNVNNLNAGVGQVDNSQQNLVTSSGIYNSNNNAQNGLANAPYKSAKNVNYQDNFAQIEGVDFQGLQQENMQTVNNYEDASGNVNSNGDTSGNRELNFQVQNVNAGVTKSISSKAQSLSDIIGTSMGKYMQSGALVTLQHYNQNAGLAPTPFNHQGTEKDNFKTISQVSDLNTKINSNQNFLATNYNSNRNDITAHHHNQLHSSITQPVTNQNLVTYKADQAYYVYSKYSGPGQPDNNVNVATKQNYKTNQAEPNSQYNTQIRQGIRNNLNTGEIKTSVQFLPSVSFQLDDEEEQKKFIAAVKSGILGDRINAYQLNVGDGGLGTFSSSQRAPANLRGYSVQKTVPVHQTFAQLQSTTPTRLYAGHSSYVAPQQSIGRFGAVVQESPRELVSPTPSIDRSYASERLEDLDEKVEGGYPRIMPSIPFTF